MFNYPRYRDPCENSERLPNTFVDRLLHPETLVVRDISLGNGSLTLFQKRKTRSIILVG